MVELKSSINQNGVPCNEKQKNTKDQLLVKPTIPEVTFCNLSDSTLGTICEDDRLKRRKRFISETGSADSIASSTTDAKKSKMPDGGFGWVVVFASLCVSLIADGISFSFGLLYTELLAYFKESKSKTAWIGSLFLAVPLMVGPVMSNLVDKYGCRRMTIIGGLVSSSGFALASLCNSIEMLYLTFGIISGLGLGIGYVTAVVSIAFWFDKKRTFATGIGASGTGIGTFLYAPFTQWLIEYFGWRGATLILAGTMLHTCIFGALMRDPEWLIEENRLESRSQSVTTFSNSSICLDEIKKMLETGAPREAVLDTLVTNCNTEANQQILDLEDIRAAKRYRSEIFLPTYFNSLDLGSIDEVKRVSRRSLRQKTDRNTISRENLISISTGNDPTSSDKKKYIASVETLSPSEKVSTILDTPFRSSLNSLNTENEYIPNKLNHEFTNERINGSRFSLNENLMAKLNDSTPNIRKNFRGNSLDILHNHDDSTREDTSLLLQGPLNSTEVEVSNGVVIPIPEGVEADFSNIQKESARKKQHDSRKMSLKRNLTLRNANYLKNMRIHRNSIHYRGALLNTHRYRLRASSCPNIYRNSMTTIAREDEEAWYDNFVDIMKSIFDFSLFLDLKFTIFNLSTLLLFIWYIIPYFYITEQMITYNYTEEDSAMLISIIGIFNTIGMVGLGFLGDRPWLNVNITYAVCLILCGLSVALMPVVITSYPALVSLSVLFGLTFASTFSFTPSILVSLVDLDDFTCAYGLVLLVQGVGSLIGPPLAGVMYDITLRWDDTFYAAGFFIALSGVLAYVIDILENRDKKNNGSDSDS